MTFESPYFQSKKEFLDYLQNRYGNLLVAYSFKTKDDTIIWSKHIPYLQLQHCALNEKPDFLKETIASFIDKINHRSILEPELVFDVDLPEQIGEVINKLKEKGVQYALFRSGSKGFHIHLILMDYYLYDVIDLKKIILKRLKTDIMKAYKGSMIALEFNSHFKTGQIKTLLENTGHMYDED